MEEKMEKGWLRKATPFMKKRKKRDYLLELMNAEEELEVARKRFKVALDHWKAILDEYREAGREVEEILGSGMEKRGDEMKK